MARGHSRGIPARRADVTLPLGGDTVSTVVGPSHIPEEIRSLDTLARPDYVDLFTATTSGATDKSPEEWARAVLEKTPTGRSAPFLWRLLGVRLGPRPSPDCVQGWKIADRGDDWIRIEATSWFMTAHAVVRSCSAKQLELTNPRGSDTARER